MKPKTNTQAEGQVQDFQFGNWIASFFKRKPAPAPAPETAPETENKSIKEQEFLVLCREWIDIQRNYPVGTKFSYLGRPMTVTEIRRYSTGFAGFGLSIPPTWPAIVTEYADNVGVIHSHTFESESLKIFADLSGGKKRKPKNKS